MTQPDAEFKLSITRALADQLDDALRKLTPATLSMNSIMALQRRAGVYQLLIHDEVVYIGKASKSLPSRLTEHARKLGGRRGFGRADVRFICLYVDEDLEASAPEKLLIKRYRADGLAQWNTNGFGNNDPGRRRDTSAVAQNHFDARFPIDLDLSLELTPHSTTVGALLAELKVRLPYLLRYENPRVSADTREEYATPVTIDARSWTAREAICLLVRALSPRWQATALPGYLLLYPENPRDYDSAMLYWRRSGEQVDEVVGPMKLGPASEVTESPDGDDGISDE